MILHIHVKQCVTLYPTFQTIICTIYAFNSTISFQICYIISLIEIVELYIFFNNKFQKKKDPCKAWVKISKVMPQPKSISPGKGREALRQKVQIFHLKYSTA